ncbi:MAG: M48 family metallopeptidase [candidate division KSB1 bacterium]|nr:M48 family metallopeptidase [candidate division KSB1 bacterium]MDZ7336337.1 M48 family metallopeptidase [candidate division KSB1 bacterium]MDZ7359016.1 M48 family metallopeptidase [candidate division KSB1 bacterium]MDZ7400021.1 M48 family metallopeptidase [candidate division KSB1 bacterium]
MTTAMVILLVIYLLLVIFGYWMKFLNLNFLRKHGHIIPKPFEGHIDGELLKKTSAYTFEHSRFGYIASIFDNILFIAFLFGGLMMIYNRWINSLDLSFVLTGIVFFLILDLVSTILGIPFDLYSTFKIENKYGFNTTTPKIWISDFIKSLLISIILLLITGGAALWIVQVSPNSWWLWIWAFFLAFSLFFMYISPYVIEPLFHKFTPITEYEGLEEKIRAMFEKVGIKVSRVFQIDASKRSTHTNAYFTGIGKVKRIILYDTLLQKMTHDEILAVLAHEAGHWKKKHILKRIIISEALGFVGFYISFRILQTSWLTDLFGIEPSANYLDKTTFFVKLIILGFIGSIISVPFSPISAYFSRKQERQADQMAVNLTGSPDGLISALIKLSKDNLSNLHPHPLYAKLYYSHPPIVQRLEQLKLMTPQEK